MVASCGWIRTRAPVACSAWKAMIAGGLRSLRGALSLVSDSGPEILRPGDRMRDRLQNLRPATTADRRAVFRAAACRRATIPGLRRVIMADRRPSIRDRRLAIRVRRPVMIAAAAEDLVEDLAVIGTAVEPCAF
jgi:hypothetical protein